MAFFLQKTGDESCFSRPSAIGGESRQSATWKGGCPMSRCLMFASLLLLAPYAAEAQAGHGCCCQGGVVYAYPQPAATAAPVRMAQASGYRSYSYEPTPAPAAAPVVAAPAPAGYRSYSYAPAYGTSYSQNYLGGGYNPPASSRGWNGAGWKLRR
jgi:hypothetical protein